MLAVEIEFLTGRYVATAHDDRSKAEWPPHPARFFSALVAEWGNHENPSDAEHDVLEQLETFGPPSIAASDASTRSSVVHYVPINDPTVIGEALWGRTTKVEKALGVLADPAANSKVKSAATKALAEARDVTDLVGGPARSGTASPMPQLRGRQARMYPSVTPDRPVIAYQWPEATLSSAERIALDSLLGRVTRLGHSSSMVTCRLVDATDADITYRPHPDGRVFLRTVSKGQLAALEHEYRGHLASRPRSLPATVSAYARGDEEQVVRVPSLPDCAGDWFVFEVESTPRLSARQAASMTAALRGALLRHADARPELLHGHQVDGKRTLLPHIAFVALPDVGHVHASGRVMGVAVLLPRDLDTESPERRAVLAAIGRWLQATNGALRLPGGQMVRCKRQRDPILHALRTRTWAAESTEWVSATPLALPWRAKKSADRANEWELAEEWVVESCRHVGLPDPEEVNVDTGPMLVGALPANKYPAFRQGGIARRLVHARVRFTEPVAGPFVLGSGRYFGLGLMRPVTGQLS